MHNVDSHCCVVVYDVNLAQFTHSTIDGYLDDFLFRVIMSSTAMNILGHVPLCTYVCVSIVHVPRSGNARSQVCVIFYLVHTAKRFSKMVVSIYNTLSTA